ncbi:unnamed protein product [Heligmosomoides polygyrus]|uniref:RBR-type E3 ubiquitin transferase n=1 Tax=Heligmosomoides polygyrus TaxID=6339 RepID=A0A183F2S2_HELPZ|nr:unnamed protein product [Heligmosomoides polygyrus]
MDELLVVLHNRADHSKRSLSIPFTLSDTVWSIEERISVVLCGRALEESTLIKDLLLGPATSLIPSVRNTPDIGTATTYNVLNCAYTAVRVHRLPLSCKRSHRAGKMYVTRSRQIEVNCANCNSISCAVFNFKCISCNEMGAVLSHIRGNWEGNQCSVYLDDHTTYLFDFGCHHMVCRQCFFECISLALKETRFVFRPPFGYTITCPYPGCERCVADVHHFRILGEEKYQLYQRVAAEKLVELDDRGVFCPYPDCNSSFFWETEDDDGRTSCPDCLRLFCRLCKSAECVCGSDDPTTITIQATTKKCPGCGAPTERNEGCTHIHCTNCRMNWCFICVAPWTEECQWNHWFD